MADHDYYRPFLYIAPKRASVGVRPGVTYRDPKKFSSCCCECKTKFPSPEHIEMTDLKIFVCFFCSDAICYPCVELAEERTTLALRQGELEFSSKRSSGTRPQLSGEIFSLGKYNVLCRPCARVEKQDLSPPLLSFHLFLLGFCKKLTAEDLQELKLIKQLPPYFLSASCSRFGDQRLAKLTRVDLSVFEEVEKIDAHFMSGLENLTEVDLNSFKNLSFIGSSFLSGCSSLKKLHVSSLCKNNSNKNPPCEVEKFFLCGANLDELEIIGADQQLTKCKFYSCNDVVMKKIGAVQNNNNNNNNNNNVTSATTKAQMNSSSSSSATAAAGSSSSYLSSSYFHPQTLTMTSGSSSSVFPSSNLVLEGELLSKFYKQIHDDDNDEKKPSAADSLSEEDREKLERVTVITHFLDCSQFLSFKALRTISSDSLRPLRNVTKISEKCFYKLSSLTSLDLTGVFSRVTSIGPNFLHDASSLKTVSLDFIRTSSCQTISFNFMAGCSSIEFLDVSPLENVFSIGSQFLSGVDLDNVFGFERLSSNGLYPSGQKKRGKFQMSRRGNEEVIRRVQRFGRKQLISDVYKVGWKSLKPLKRAVGQSRVRRLVLEFLLDFSSS